MAGYSKLLLLFSTGTIAGFINVNAGVAAAAYCKEAGGAQGAHHPLSRFFQYPD